MRKLLLSLFVGYFFLCLNPVFGTDWGDSGLDKNDAPSEIYIAWEVTTQYGDSSSKPDYAYFAFANKDYNYMRIPQGAPKPDIDFMAMCVLTSTNSFDFYRTIANKVNIHLSQLDLDWLFYFTTKSGNPAKVTFRCLVNNLPANTTVSVRLLTVDNQEFPITALTEGLPTFRPTPSWPPMRFRKSPTPNSLCLWNLAGTWWAFPSWRSQTLATSLIIP